MIVCVSNGKLGITTVYRRPRLQAQKVEARTGDQPNDDGIRRLRALVACFDPRLATAI